VTGTGKSHQGLGESLLFVAHRKEILDQALRTYREALATSHSRRTCSTGSPRTARPATRPQATAISRGGSRVLLFVRAARNDDVGSAPYVCLGQATLADHRGERPIAITWLLHRAMPPKVLQQGAVASG
jgi:hypothetical protein